MLGPFRLFWLLCFAVAKVESWKHLPPYMLHLPGHPVEIALLFLDTYGVTVVDEFEMQWRIARNLEDTFIISDNQTRVAVVLHKDRPSIYLNWTSDPMVVRKLEDTARRDERPVKSPVDGIKLIRERILVNLRPYAKKLLIMFCIKYCESTDIVAEAEALRNDSVEIYVVYGAYSSPNEQEMAEKITGNPGRVYDTRHILSLTTDVYRRYVCYFEKCVYHDPNRDRCVATWITMKNSNCAFGKPSVPPMKKCDPSDCVLWCNLVWPLERETCKFSDCGTIWVNRSEPFSLAELEWYQYCPAIVPITCPFTCVQPPTTKGKTSTEIGEITDAPTVKTGTQKDDFPMWLIAVIVTVCLLILAAIVIAVIVTRKKQQRKLAAALMIRKRTVAAGMMKSMKEPSKILMKPKSPVAAIVGFGKVGRGVDESVLASISDSVLVKGASVAKSGKKHGSIKSGHMKRK